MGSSNIAWCDETLNIGIGCTRKTEKDARGVIVPGGCDNCWAFEWHDRHYKAFLEGKEVLPQFRVPFSAAWHNQGVQLHPERLEEVEHWRKRRRVFVNSVSDFWHESVPDSYIMQCLEFFRAHPRHIFQLLTKRVERQRDFMRKHYPHGIANVWHMASIASQHYADEWIPYLLETPAAVRGISMEPMLGAVDLSPWLVFPGEYDKAEWCLAHYGHSQPLHWVIVGGESGRFARPLEAERAGDIEGYARTIQRQCADANIAFFMKQMGSRYAREVSRTYAKDPHGSKRLTIPADLFVQQFPDEMEAA